MKLYFHPLSSFCHKVLIAFYENGTAFDPVVVNFVDKDSEIAFKAVWPFGKIPALRDDDRRVTIGESTSIIEFLDACHPGPTRFVSADPLLAGETRMWDRVLDHYVHEPMQKVITDNLRPEGANDSFGVEQAVSRIRNAYEQLDRRMEARTWLVGDAFSLADCAAAPALFYANAAVPMDDGKEALAAYLDRLVARPSYARVLEEAEPYFKYVPLARKPEVPKRKPGAG
jgi:glutathione S-transferase